MEKNQTNEPSSSSDNEISSSIFGSTTGDFMGTYKDAFSHAGGDDDETNGYDDESEQGDESGDLENEDGLDDKAGGEGLQDDDDEGAGEGEEEAEEGNEEDPITERELEIARRERELEERDIEQRIANGELLAGFDKPTVQYLQNYGKETEGRINGFMNHIDRVTDQMFEERVDSLLTTFNETGSLDEQGAVGLIQDLVKHMGDFQKLTKEALMKESEKSILKATRDFDKAFRKYQEQNQFQPQEEEAGIEGDLVEGISAKAIELGIDDIDVLGDIYDEVETLVNNGNDLNKSIGHVFGKYHKLIQQGENKAKQETQQTAQRAKTTAPFKGNNGGSKTNDINLLTDDIFALAKAGKINLK